MKQETEKSESKEKNYAAELEAYYEKLADMSGNTEQTRFFMLLLNHKIKQVEDKEKKSSSTRRWLGVTGLVASSIATVVIGLKLGKMSDLQANIALGLSALVTLISAIATFWDIDNYWLRIRLMLEKLKLLRYRYAFLLSHSPEKPPTDAEMNALMDDFRSIVGDGYWEKLTPKDLLPKGWRDLSEEQMEVLKGLLKKEQKAGPSDQEPNG